MFNKFTKGKKANRKQAIIVQELVSKIVDETVGALKNDPVFKRKIVNIVLNNTNVRDGENN